MNKDALADTVYEAFGSMYKAVLCNVNRYWITVLDLVVEGEGSNDLVEQKCLQFRTNPMEESNDKDIVELISLLDEMNMVNEME